MNIDDREPDFAPYTFLFVEKGIGDGARQLEVRTVRKYSTNQLVTQLSRQELTLKHQIDHQTTNINDRETVFAPTTFHLIVKGVGEGPR